jgi:hypothetical protein
MLIRGQEVPAVTKMMGQDKLQFYVDNPRVFHLAQWRKEQAFPRGYSGPSATLRARQELREDIKVNKGLLKPLIVKSGTLEVLEGNSRLAAYRVSKEP